MVLLLKGFVSSTSLAVLSEKTTTSGGSGGERFPFRLDYSSSNNSTKKKSGSTGTMLKTNMSPSSSSNDRSQQRRTNGGGGGGSGRSVSKNAPTYYHHYETLANTIVKDNELYKELMNRVRASKVRTNMGAAEMLNSTLLISMERLVFDKYPELERDFILRHQQQLDEQERSLQQPDSTRTTAGGFASSILSSIQQGLADMGVMQVGSNSNTNTAGTSSSSASRNRNATFNRIEEGAAVVVAKQQGTRRRFSLSAGSLVGGGSTQSSAAVVGISGISNTSSVNSTRNSIWTDYDLTTTTPTAGAATTATGSEQEEACTYMPPPSRSTGSTGRLSGTINGSPVSTSSSTRRSRRSSLDHVSCLSSTLKEKIKAGNHNMINLAGQPTNTTTLTNTSTRRRATLSFGSSSTGMNSTTTTAATTASKPFTTTAITTKSRPAAHAKNNNKQNNNNKARSSLSDVFGSYFLEPIKDDHDEGSQSQIQTTRNGSSGTYVVPFDEPSRPGVANTKASYTTVNQNNERDSVLASSFNSFSSESSSQGGGGGGAKLQSIVSRAVGVLERGAKRGSQIFLAPDAATISAEMEQFNSSNGSGSFNYYDDETFIPPSERIVVASNVRRMTDSCYFGAWGDEDDEDDHHHEDDEEDDDDADEEPQLPNKQLNSNNA